MGKNKVSVIFLKGKSLLLKVQGN